MRWISLLFIAILALPPRAQATDPIIIKFSHTVASDSPKGRAAIKFKELAEAMTQSRVKVLVYPNGQLHQDRQELEALQMNAVQMLAPALAKLAPLGIREFELFDLPYLFPDETVLHQVMDGPIGQGLLQRLEEKGLLGLAYWDSGFKHFSANRPLRTLEDFRGLRMRIQPSRVLDAQMRALNAIPQATSQAEIYGALERGVVDGTENHSAQFDNQQLIKVQKHLTLSRHGFVGYVVLVNQRVWSDLPGNIRLALEQALRLATQYERQIAVEHNHQSLARIRASGKTEIYTLPQSERERLRKQMLPVHRQFMKVIGPDLIEAAYRIAAESVF
ncbi:DctP family TRAP transporter solute-binding subunit [Chitinimonas sp. BJB300]|uniref:DctP family TRAP transporter solute-binding subunit n=1 Tax=Chitinimonas sp. BJB300 TaxID=1559339 RepID=UPI000C0C8A19|nr:DctP family TRAP transporter solute-binding subunit [Chitinimonas sp. BJB300]PHV12338.1 C4-dicarboxylate ABC transporter [Chitinimonas sp. BJB300]TSJ90959.1 DctP family TRAP transporter solute-binding subunit [Chitinimonas sp. BJB300]